MDVIKHLLGQINYNTVEAEAHKARADARRGEAEHYDKLAQECLGAVAALSAAIKKLEE